MIKKWLFRLLLALLLVSSFSIFGLQQNNSGNKVTKVFKQILTGGMVGVAYAIAPDYLFDGVADDVQAQQMLNDLPTTGGKMILYAGHYSFTATVSRAVDNVTVAGSGAGTYISYNNSTAVFSAGTRTGWIFEDLSTDNGGIYCCT